MASHFLLELDTTAPAVEWGTVAGAEAGQLLQVAYTVDEPELVEAELVSAAGEHVTLSVLADRVEGYLPPTISGGEATLIATTRDEVDNEATVTIGIPILSPTGPPPSVPRVGPGVRPSAPPARRRDHPERRTVRSSSRVRVTSRSTIHRSPIVTRSRVESTSRSAVRAALEQRGRLETSSSSRLEVRVYPGTAVRTSSSHRVRRREGPDEEALLLDLL